MPIAVAIAVAAMFAMLAYLGGKTEDRRASVARTCIEAGGEWSGIDCTRPPQPTAKTCQRPTP